MERELTRLRLGPPYALRYSLLNAEPARLTRDGMGLDADRFDRGILLFPDIATSDPVDADIILRPLFDLVAQAAGITAAPNYDANGRWQGRG
jgi:hypothetical protein